MQGHKPYILHLTSRPDGWGAKRLREAARESGIHTRSADPHRTMLEISGDGDCARVHGRRIPRPSVVLPRLGPGNYEDGLAAIGHFEAVGIPVVNSAHAIGIARDTYQTLLKLKAAGLKVPSTARIISMKALRAAKKSIPGPPWILKTFTGAMGIGTMLIHKTDQLEAVAATLWALKQPMLLQEFIHPGNPEYVADYRAFVIGGEIIGIIRRTAGEGEFRANVHRGGTPERVVPSHKHERIAKRAAKAIGLELAGVDWIETADGPVVLEANATPGFQGFEDATGINVARAIIEYARSKIS